MVAVLSAAAKEVAAAVAIATAAIVVVAIAVAAAAKAAAAVAVVVVIAAAAAAKAAAAAVVGEIGATAPLKSQMKSLKQGQKIENVVLRQKVRCVGVMGCYGGGVVVVVVVVVTGVSGLSDTVVDCRPKIELDLKDSSEQTLREARQFEEKMVRLRARAWTLSWATACTCIFDARMGTRARAG